MSCAKTVERIEMLFGVWIQVGPRKHVLHGGAHWSHLLNTIVPSVCSLLLNYFDHLFTYFQLCPWLCVICLVTVLICCPCMFHVCVRVNVLLCEFCTVYNSAAAVIAAVHLVKFACKP